MERGIDFREARQLWDDPHSISFPARTIGFEARHATVGKLREKLWVAIWTARGCIRIISVRRAENTKFERSYYEYQ
jgi:uncharacterized DUF497 family protein